MIHNTPHYGHRFNAYNGENNNSEIISQLKATIEKMKAEKIQLSQLNKTTKIVLLVAVATFILSLLIKKDTGMIPDIASRMKRL